MPSPASPSAEPLPTPSPAPLAQRAFGAFMRAMHAHRQLMARKMSEHGVAPGQAFCLREVAHRDGITQRDLAEVLNVARPTLTVMLQKMEKTGLIERRNDEQDQRYTRIYLADKGEAMHQALHSVVGEVVDETVGQLSEKDQAELVRLMGLVHDTMTDALDGRTAANEKAPEPRTPRENRR